MRAGPPVITGPVPITTAIPARLDRLPWISRHTRIVVALGITWVLDGLEVTIVGALGSALQAKEALGLRSEQVGLAGSGYLAGAIIGALAFGRVADRIGRKRLFVLTLALYVGATVATGLAFDFTSFLVARFLTGTAIGGEYAAINSAIDELLPARVRGVADLAINGSYWLGTAAGAAATIVLLDPRLVPIWLGWRLAFGLGALLAVAVVVVRRYVPESPRWLLLHGREREAEEIVAAMEADARATGAAVEPPSGTLRIVPRGPIGFGQIARVVFGRYRRRAVLGLSMMIAQAFFYNAIFFTYALVLTRFFGVPPDRVGVHLIFFAAGNLLGPLVLGRLFDRVGRRPMIVTTYAVSGLLLLATGALFERGLLDATTQTLAWSVTFFFASAAASSAYLTVGELFPLEIRALSIAFFYAVGTGAGGVMAPTVFAALVGSGEPRQLFAGYAVAAALMLGAAGIAAAFAVSAEGRSLEDIAAPLSAAGADVLSEPDSRRAP